jgi:hypothetical protein
MPTIFTINLPAFPLIVLGSFGREIPISTAGIIFMNAGWAIFSGLVWAFLFAPLFQERKNK